MGQFTFSGGGGGGGGAVSSVFGRTGAVVAANGDYTASNITNVAAGNIAAVTVQAAINELDTEKGGLALANSWSALNTFTTTGNNSLVVNGNGNDGHVVATSYQSAVGGGGMVMRHARGTLASPTVLLNQDEAGELHFRGYGGTAFRDAAFIAAVVTETTPSDTAMGSRIEFLTSPTGTVVPVEVARLESATGLTMAGSNPVNTARVNLAGNVSAAAWTTAGVGLFTTARTLTDTSSSGTVATAYTNVLGGNTIAASSSTTFTDYATMFFGDPTAGTNVTITNALSLVTAGATRIGGSIRAASVDLAGTQAADSIGTRGVPQISQSADYTLVITDAGKHILHPTADNNARTFTIPANGSVAYPVGTVLTFINQINTVTIAITTDTMTLAGSASTGSRTLGLNGIAACVKVAATEWIISGPGLT
jgi:hypothetical protein